MGSSVLEECSSIIHQMPVLWLDEESTRTCLSAEM